MISLKKVTKRYGDLTVYNGFDFDISEGQITCILGESGSGKTTLLNMLAGLTDYEGDITKKSCSYIFQQPRLLPNLTVRGNLALVCKDKAAVSSMISAVQLTEKADSYPVTLSGGQAQRAAIARAFLYPSDVILMDEPFASLDLGLKLKMAALFLDLWRKNKRTAVFVTHDVDEALMLSHRIAVLKDGEVKQQFYPEGDPCADLFARTALRQQLLTSLL